MLVSATLSVAFAAMSMLLPVHALFPGFVIVTIGLVVSPGGVGLLTVTDTAAVAVRPAPSVTVRFSVCGPFEYGPVLHVVDVEELGTLPPKSVLLSVLSTLSVKCGVPEAPLEYGPVLHVVDVEELGTLPPKSVL